MIENALVYIHGTGARNRFFGCGVVVEGSFIATCRHVWRDATGGEDRAGAAVEFPRSLLDGKAAMRPVTLASACNGDARPLDLVLLAVEGMPPGVTAVAAAMEARFETGEATALARVRREEAPSMGVWVDEVQIDGRLREGAPRPDGRRQFTGKDEPGYWFERGSSGSPLFLKGGQQLAGLLSLSELGANDRKSDLKEAFVVPGSAIRRHLVALIAAAEAQRLSLPRAQLQPLLDAIGAADAPIAEIPARLHAAVTGARQQAAAPPPRSNDGTDIDATLAAARAETGRFAFAEALATLDAKLAEEEETRRRRLLPLLGERAAVQALAFDSAGRRATLAQIAALDPDDAWSWFHLGDAHWHAGERVAARTSFERGRDAAERRGDRRDTAISLERIGNVLLAEGKRAEALDAYRASLAIRDALARQDAGNALWQRDLSVSHIKLGDVLRAEGKRPEALAAYRASLAIREALTRQDAGNAEWQRDLSVSYIKLGNVLLAEWNQREALDAYGAGLAIAEVLARKEPGNVEWQRDLLVGHNKVGDVLFAEGKRAAALDAYRASLKIAEALALHDAGNAEWQRDLSVSHDRIGDVLLAEGKRAEALEAYRAGLAIAEALARADAGNAEWQRDLLVSCAKLAEAEPQAARSWLHRAIAIEASLRARGALAPPDTWVAEALAQKLAALPPP
jgi:tetratricopeptide (TPR) repeat protein